MLIAAPTGSGKTFAAFLSCIDHLFKQALARDLHDHTQVLYVSPLKALSNDIQKNLQQPLAEIGNAAFAAGILMPGSSGYRRAARRVRGGSFGLGAAFTPDETVEI